MGLTVKDPGQGGRLLQVGLTQVFWKVGLEPIKRAALFLLTPPPQTATQQSKASERELSDEETADLCDEEFKALIIKMLTELTELG